ncbi:helix-turn-helix transcriptional regulator [Actinophytocola sediminis]
MANTSSRTLRLLSLLQNHRFWPGTTLAERLGVSVRTLRRDIDRLRELGYPVAATRGVDGGYQLAVGGALPPLVIDDEEAVALIVGLQNAAQSTVAGVAESSVRALAKVTQVMPARLRRRAEALSAMTVPLEWFGQQPPTIDPDILTAIALSCRDTERLRFAYTAATGNHTDRHVEPHRLVSLGRRWYLVAYDLDRHDWRTFRLDRLAEPRTTGAQFLPRALPAADAAAFVRAHLDNAVRPVAVEAVVDAPSATVGDRVGRWAAVEAVDDTHARVRLTTDSPSWALLILGASGADFHVVGPPELRAELRDWGTRFLRAAGPGS